MSFAKFMHSFDNAERMKITTACIQNWAALFISVLCTVIEDSVCSLYCNWRFGFRASHCLTCRVVLKKLFVCGAKNLCFLTFRGEYKHFPITVVDSILCNHAKHSTPAQVAMVCVSGPLTFTGMLIAVKAILQKRLGRGMMHFHCRRPG